MLTISFFNNQTNPGPESIKLLDEDLFLIYIILHSMCFSANNKENVPEQCSSKTYTLEPMISFNSVAIGSTICDSLMPHVLYNCEPTNKKYLTQLYKHKIWIA